MLLVHTTANAATKIMSETRDTTYTSKERDAHGRLSSVETEQSGKRLELLQTR